VSERIPVLYLAPWVGYGGSDTNTIDWFRWIDRERFAPALITTQPSPNPLIDQVEPYADELWVLPDLMPAADMPAFILDFLSTRQIRLIHLMNSRIGFDLLPDVACLPSPPAVVVQMHAEETDRSGYVRYVTTRYGDLVDCFSLSNEHVADAVREYGIPEERIRVIYTGADAEGEFSPDLAEPIEELPREQLQILFAARLVEQKDPLLMVEVAASLRDAGADFQIHVVGEGDLEEQVEARIAELELGGHVILHPPTAGLLRWYAACDVLLLTSTFEGIPVVIFEAMAMGLPIVTPGLPAIREMLEDGDDGVVAPRDSVSGYVEALARFAADRTHLAARGREMRARAKEQFSVQQMAARHGELYGELVEARAGGAGGPLAAPAAQPQLPPLAALTAAGGGPQPLASALGADPQLCEKVRRRFAAAAEELDAIALADAGGDGRFGFRSLPLGDGPADLTPHTVVWRRDFERFLPQGLDGGGEVTVDSVAWLLAAAGARLEWRHLPTPGGAGSPQPSAPGGAAVPAAAGYRVPRWDQLSTWIPPRSRVAVRCRELEGERRLISSDGTIPPGFECEHVLGCLRDQEFQGTAKLVEVQGSYRALAPGQERQAADGAVELGYVELAPLPGMDPLSLAVHRASGQQVLVNSPDDPLLPEVDVGAHLGFVDPVPLRPRQVPPAERPQGLRGLVKTVDYAARRHRYASGSPPEGEMVAELGALAESALGGSIPAWIVDGFLLTDRHRPPAPRPGYGEAARWVAEPLSWGGLASVAARGKALARRATVVLGRRAREAPAGAVPSEEPSGWLFESPRPGLTPLHASYHPVTGDQLLTHSTETAAQMGYAGSVLLGFLRELPLLTEDLQERQLPVPWARRFGAVPRVG
jgi:glycosyltransferase involved in cell wall biosynthesis